jgi:glycine reductase
VSISVGANRIVPTISIPYPLGDPNTPKKEQYKLRFNKVSLALEALTKDIEEQTIFEK